MVAKTTPAPDIDEDIIELTDIIEQGTPPTPDASVASMDDQLTDLLNAGAGGEAQDDLDALLAEIGTTPQAGTPNAGEQTGPHPVNPDETLDMPDMQEVENLLDELSIPPQPSALSDPAAAEQDVGSLDDILDQLGGAGQPATLAATPDPVDELDALLDGVTATSITSMPSDATPIEESNALPDKVPASSPTSPPATRKAKTSVTVTISPVATSSAPSVGAAPPKTSGTAAANSADDMDALLESATATAPAPPEISQSLSLADDLDASRESVPSAGPVPPIDEKPPSPPERTAPEADDAAPPTAPASSTVAPETAVIAEMPPLPHQWEALLGGASESSLPTQSSAPPPGAVPVSPDILEQLARMEKRLMELDETSFAARELKTRLDALEDKYTVAEQADTHAVRLAALEERIRALEDNAGAAPVVTEEGILAAVHVTLEKMEQRINALEKTLQEVTTVQPEASGPDNPDLQGLLALLRGTEEGLERLEARLEKMESSAGEELDRAAAAAAARILREELAAILTDGAT